MMSAQGIVDEARGVLTTPLASRVNRLGGYGANGEVIYEAHPAACPTVLVDTQANATATFTSNGSVGMVVKPDDGPEVAVLKTHFDTNEKREIHPPSSNVWLRLRGEMIRAVSLMNSRNNINCAPGGMRVVKLGDPGRAMWYGNWFDNGKGLAFSTAVKVSLVQSSTGPALLRQVFIENTGDLILEADLWTYYSLPGSQRFAYNKSIWYDAGLPLDDRETIVCAAVPYSDIRQIKRISTRTRGLAVLDSTCDYGNFIGDSASTALWPAAVLSGGFSQGGAGKGLNRFSIPTIAAMQFELAAEPGEIATIDQSLQYITDKDLINAFRESSGTRDPHYTQIASAFRKSAEGLVAKSPDVTSLLKPAGAEGATGGENRYFALSLPKEPVVAHYANSVWTGVSELYENCRAHGARLADGIELGTRDRGQDMWPKLKENPGRVRADLIHAMSFMYQTVDADELVQETGQLSLRQKLHGMFPRQYPSVWLDREKEIFNDNRPYSDSPLWLINSLCLYIRETGDLSILTETVQSIHLTDPDRPETSGIIGCKNTWHIAQVVEEVFACFERHAEDSPYGLCQILYGDWCDPVDMFGTSEVGNAATRGQGRGVQVRLSAHVVLSLVEYIDLLESGDARQRLHGKGVEIDTGRLKRFADRLRRRIVEVAWEDDGTYPAFISVIHELKVDGSVPDYLNGDLGYTLGSYKGRDFDGVRRRDLGPQGFCLGMLNIDRPYLDPVPGRDEIVSKIISTIDTLFYDEQLGLVMYSVPLSNHQETVDRVGRMGVLPTGTAENGEYHHCQVMTHCFRMEWKDQADAAWEQFKPMMSAMRDDGIGGPFDMPCTSYAADREDPHFGKGMYFGLSGSTDWMIELFQRLAGVKLALHDPDQPDLSVHPRLPASLGHSLTFKRMIHAATGDGRYDRIPLTIAISRSGTGDSLKSTRYVVNGEECPVADVDDVRSFALGLVIEIEYQFA